jgi:hypothetical protein
MSGPDELIAAALDGADAPLDPAFAKRVHAIAKAELIPPRSIADPLGQLRLALSGALVPALLVSAACARVVQTVEVAKTVFTEGGN